MAHRESSGNSRVGPGIVLVLLAMIAVPAGITLHMVSDPGQLQLTSRNPTPYGYTWSLLLFLIPIVVIAFWFLPQEGISIPKGAFWRTILILAPCGFGLDFFFAHTFFTFENSGATLGIRAPALGAPVPIEEYIFYLTGFMAVLLIYIWLNEYWLAAYNVEDYPTRSKQIPRLVQFHPTSLLLGASLIIAAILYKRFISSEPAGFPGYFTVLVIGGLIPSAGFFPTVRSTINWRAFSLALFYVVLISLLWEATLALPYNWWNYQHPQMVGLFVRAWSRLPIEAVFVWMAVSYGTVIVFEVVKLWKASGRKAREAFLGLTTAAGKSGSAAGK